MSTGYSNFEKHIMTDATYDCPICGAKRYVTDQGNHELTLHCTSAEARFWDFERGTAEQRDAMEHWDRSRKEVFLSAEDVLMYLVDHEAAVEAGLVPAIANPGGIQLPPGKG